MSMMESHPWRPQRGLPERSVSVLRAWLFEHFLHPVRLWKPMVEEMYLEETKEHENNMVSSDNGGTDGGDDNNNNDRLNIPLTDQKPTPDQLVRVDSECLSSIITTNPEKNDGKSGTRTLENQHLHHHHHHHHHHHQQQSFGTYGATAMELDFASYGDHTAGGGVPYHNANQSFNGGGGVSLTLGLQQHGGSGVSLAFSPATQTSLFYRRDHIEDCQPVQYSLLDNEGQHLPYRNLMGAQLLHDLAG
ncbi:hypothetical protein Goari_007442 [Gossypium aridum]|uniref:Uncharacterized protein n=1 Tax=Gossypium aridum TaxID=34290 RepID=A0A7J8XR26_GOSAI|nr:hypothetical protein [Gossypium aridum]